MSWPIVHLRRVARFAYGESLADGVRTDGNVAVYGSNGSVGSHTTPNTRRPVLIIGRKGSFGKIQYSKDPVFAIDTTFYIDKRYTSANLRWLYYVLLTLRLDDLSEDVGVPGLSREKAYEQSIQLPSPVQQVAIASYLDRETGRIDALIAAKQRIVELLEEHFWSWVNRQVDRHVTAYLPLRRFLTRIIDGPFGSSLTSSDYSESGARVVRLGNVGRGCFRNEDIAYISSTYFKKLLRHRVVEGDLLIAGLGDTNNHVGRACVAPKLGLAIVKADCYCASVNPARGLAEFLALFLSSPLGAKNVAVAARGTTRSRINLDIAREIEIPVLPLSVQGKITAAAVIMRRRCDELLQALQLQADLLQERRQALIAAAVAGKLDIPEAA